MNISLPDSLRDLVEGQVAARGYGSVSDYVRDLIRHDVDVQTFRALIREGLDSGPGPVADQAYFDGLKARIRAAGAA